MAKATKLYKRIKEVITKLLAREDCYLDTVIIILLITITISFILLLIGMQKQVIEEEQGDSNDIDDALENKCPCSNVLEYGVKGQWIRDTTKKFNRYLDDSELRRKLKLPDRLHRDDLRCGFNYPLANSTLPSACQSKGEYPCCNEKTGWCGKTKLHCQNPLTTNYQDFVHHKEAVWKPAEDKCAMEEISQKEACGILSENGFYLIFIGDSLARKFFASFLLFLSENHSHGLLNPDMTSKVKHYCQEELQILNPSCKQFTIKSSIQMDDTGACGFQTDFLVEYFGDFNTFVTKETEERITSLVNITNSYIILNAGVHFNSQWGSFIDYYLSYIALLLKDVEWPKVIVESLPRVPSVTISDQRGLFRDSVRKFSKDNKMLFLDNFNLTNNLLPFDGKHFGVNFHRLKVNILLNLLKKQSEEC